MAIELNKFIEHTALGDGLDESKLIAHIKEAISLKVFAVCLNLAWVRLAKSELAGTNIKLVTVIDFPLGNKSPEDKALETKAAKIFGADEIDMVINYQAIIDKNYQLALEGILAVIKEAGNLLVKVIIETSALNQNQISIACALVSLAKADFIKTSTGFHKAGAKLEDIFLIRSLLPKTIGIKASGGIKDRSTAMAMIEAGADRIGTSSSAAILRENHANS